MKIDMYGRIIEPDIDKAFKARLTLTAEFPSPSSPSSRGPYGQNNGRQAKAMWSELVDFA